MGDDGYRVITIMVQVNHTNPQLNITVIKLPLKTILLHMGNLLMYIEIISCNQSVLSLLPDYIAESLVLSLSSFQYPLFARD